MTSDTPAIAHLPFFEALAGMSEASAEWSATSAEVVTLRLFDAWVRGGPRFVAAEPWKFQAVRQAIGAIHEGDATRELLLRIVETMEASRTVRTSGVAPHLMAYARSLQIAGKWTLAADVYGTALSHAESADEVDIAIVASRQIGACLRMVARWEDALAAYAAAIRIATRVGDIANLLNSRIGEANVAAGRGNLPEAEAILDETIQRATAHRLEDVHARALHDRGSVARRRGDFDLAVRCLYAALELYADQAAKERTLTDLAATFTDMGWLDVARDTNLILAATGHEQIVRWAAMINLVEIAVRDSQEAAFEHHRRELAGVQLSAPLAAHYHLYVAQGYRQFGRVEDAERALEHAIAFAARHEVNEVLFKAEQSLDELHAGRPVRTAHVPSVAEPSQAVLDVAGAIRNMRVLAGVTGA